MTLGRLEAGSDEGRSGLSGGAAMRDVTKKAVIATTTVVTAKKKKRYRGKTPCYMGGGELIVREANRTDHLCQ